MARRKPSYTPQPRILTSPHQVAALLGRGEEWFRKNRAALERAGFPRRDPLLDGWDAAAIEAWLDRRAGLRRVVGIDSFGPGGEHGGLHNPWDAADPADDGKDRPPLS